METTRQPCPECGATLELPASASGRKARCPACQTTFVVPSSGTTPPAAAKFPGGESGGDAGEHSPHEPASAAPESGGAGRSGEANRPSDDPFSTPIQRPNTPASNPYAINAGMASAAVEPAKHGELLIRTPNIDSIVSATVSIFTGRWQPLVIGGLIIFALNIVTSIAGQIVPMLGSVLGEAGLLVGTVLLQIASSLIGFYLTCGLIRTALAVARNQPAPVSKMFPNPGLFGRVLVTILIPILVLSIIGGVLGGIGVAIYYASGQADAAALIMAVFGGLLFFVVYLAIFLLLWPSVYVACDERGWGVSALRTGYAIGMVNKLNSFLFMLISMGLSILGLLLCCLGHIATTPATFLLAGVGYLMMTSQPISDPAQAQFQPQPPRYGDENYGNPNYGNPNYPEG